MRPQRFLAPRFARAQHIQTHPRDRRGQPAASTVPTAAKSRTAGETDERLFAVAAWRDSPYFSDAERAAFALTEAVTRLSDRTDPVPDEIWNEAARHYDEPTLATLLIGIANINVWNRLNVATRQPAGVWKP
jgi:alkylhydroperoxidase family enzyme